MSRLTPRLQAVLEAADCPHVTVVRSGGLGDTLLTLPVLRLLAEAPSRPSLTLVGSAWAEQLWPMLALRCHLLRLDAPGFTPLFAPGAAADPTGAFAEADAAVVFTTAGSDLLAENIRRVCPGPVLTRSVQPPPGVHAARHFLGAVCTDRRTAVPLPPLRPSPERLEWAGRWIEAAFGRGPAPLAVHPGSGGRRKCWPAKHFAAVLDAERRPVLLIQGPADAEAVASVMRLMPGHVTAVTARNLQLADLAALLCRCHALIANDSGVSHLAGVLGAPTVAVFGPTDPAAWAPLGPNARAVGGCGTWPDPADVRAHLPRAGD